MKKRLRIITYSSLGLFLLALAAAYGLLHSPAVSRFALRYLTEEASGALEGTLTFASADGNLATGMTVTGLAVSSPEREWLVIDSLSLRYDPIALVFGLFHLKEVHADGLRLTVSRDDQGRLGLPFLGGGGDAALSARGWKILGRLDSVRLSNGAVRVLDPDGVEEKQLRLEDLHFRGRFGFSSFFARGGWSGWCEVGESGFLHADSGLRVSASVRKVLVHPDSLEIVEARVATPFSSVVFHLRKPRGKNVPPVLTWHAPSIDLRELGGPVSLKLASSGSLKGLPRTPELWEAGAHLSEWPSGYRLSQEIEFGGSHVSVNGELSFAAGWLAPVFRGTAGFSVPEPSSLMSLLQEASGDAPEALRDGLTRLATGIARTQVAGPLAGEVELEMHHAAPAPFGVSGLLALRSGSIAGEAIRDLRLPFRWSGKTISVSEASLATDAGDIRLESFLAGEIPDGGEARAPWRLAASFSGLAAGRLLRIPDLPGEVSGSVRLEGVTDGLRGDLSLGPVKLSQLEIASASASALFRQGPDGFSLDRLELALDGQRIIGRGEVAGDTLKLDLTARDLPLSLLAPEARGSIDADCAINGALGAPRLEATIQAKGAGLEDLAAEKFSVRLQMPDPLHDRKAGLSLEGAALRVGKTQMESFTATVEVTSPDRFLVRSAEAVMAGERWRLAAPVAVSAASGVFSVGKAEFGGGLGKSAQVSGGWARGGKVEGVVALRNFPLVLPVPGADMSVGGRLDAEAVLHGSAFAPSGTVTATFSAEGNGLVNRVQARGSLTEGRLTAEAELETPAGTVRLQDFVLTLAKAGAYPFAPDPASVSGDIVASSLDLDKLRLPGQRPLSGRLAARGHIASFAEGWPEMTGEFELAGAGIAFPALDVRFQAARGGFALTPGRLALSGAEVESSGGALSVDGTVRLGEEGLGDLQLAVGARRLAVSLQQGVHRAVLSGDVRLSGTPAKPAIAGAVTLEEVVTRFPQHWEIADISSDVVLFDSRNAAVGSKRKNFFEELEEELAGVGLALTVDVPGKMDLSLGALRLLLKGGLTARTEAGRLILNGSFSPEQGEYLVRGRVFKVTEGTVTFSEETGMNGGLHARAVCQLPGALITASVRGTINVPEIYLESDPWMPEEDIMASVVLGRPRTPAELRDATEKGAMASVLVGESILDRFREMTGRRTLLETISVYGGTTREGEHSVSVGKYLSENLLVSYEYMLSTGEPGQVSMEYKLGHGFSVESQVQGAEQKGVDLLWKKDF